MCWVLLTVSGARSGEMWQEGGSELDFGGMLGWAGDRNRDVSLFPCV